MRLDVGGGVRPGLGGGRAHHGRQQDRGQQNGFARHGNPLVRKPRLAHENPHLKAPCCCRLAAEINRPSVEASMGRWNEMKEPESLEDYAARLAQQNERWPMGLSAGGGPLRIAQPLAARGAVEGLSGVAAVPRPTPRPVGPEEWVQL